LKNKIKGMFMVKVQPLMHPALLKIIARFPEYHDVVCKLFRIDYSFNELCVDYEQCCQTLRHWQTQNTELSKQRIAEYDEILRSLEEEIKQYLMEYKVVPKGWNKI
jgi:hypothetical protein